MVMQRKKWYEKVFVFRECDPKGQWDCMIDDVAMH